MSLTRSAITKNRITLSVLAILIFAGVGTYIGMPRAKDPGFVMRVAQVVTIFPGASPDRVAQLVSEPLENAIREIPELDFVSSESKNGVSVVFVGIKESEKVMRPVWDNLRRKVDIVAASLPEGALKPDVNDDFGDVYGLVVMITGEGFSAVELEDIAKDTRDELLRIHDASKVDIYGTQPERIFVEYTGTRLANVGLTPNALMGALSSRNVLTPGGSISTGDERITLEPSGNFDSLEELRHTLIPLPRGGLIRLEDVAEITRGAVDPPTRIVWFHGKRAVAIGVSLREGGNIVQLGEDVRATLARVEASQPLGITFEPIFYLADDVVTTISGFEGNLLQAIAIVFASMLLFLGLRTGLLIATLVPMTMVTTFVVMSLFNIGLDQVSLASLIIALGMLVDNAIVMAEAIMVRRASGEDKIEAAVGATNELRAPLLISSLTTSAAFLPIFLAESAVGEFTASIFKVVTISLISSWVLALTMIPLFTVLFMKVKAAAANHDPMGTRFYRGYRKVIVGALKHRMLTGVLVIAAFAGAMVLMGKVPALFFPPDNQPFMVIKMTLPIGTPIEQINEVATTVEDYLQGELSAGRSEEMEWNPKTRVWQHKYTYEGEGVTTSAAFVGGGTPKFVLGFNPDPPTPNYAVILANATSDAATTEMMPKIERFAQDRFPDLRIVVERLQSGPPVADPVAVRVSGQDQAALFGIVEQVKKRFAQTPGTRDIIDNWGRFSKKLFIDIDGARAQRVGASNQDVAVSLQAGLSGISQTSFREGDKSIPITLRSASAERQDVGKLETLNIYASQTGQPVPLKQIAEPHLVWEPAVILRRDGALSVNISSQLAPGANAAVVAKEIGILLAQDQKSWPTGYRYEVGGAADASNEANKSIGDKMPLAFAIIVMLLIGTFNSLRRASIVLLTIPLAMIGVSIGLYAMGSYFGFMTLLGIISLAGIVINNAIVLLDRIRIEIDDNGLEPSHAIIQAAQLRLRPILLTTATTIGGLIPLWLGGGVMWEPMAIAIIFGLLFATVLTLGVVPLLYSVFYRVSYRSFDTDAYYPPADKIVTTPKIAG